ncbi:cilia- and flagella-associated protein 53 isoform X2 [Hydra vulgaris]|uniref:Cilia- and flagella-associated protein 53 isoform X2 n=1 Tax=Hydra vulgaris TaxID=6087 RepID=A0ABM4DEW5_HYDVU
MTYTLQRHREFTGPTPHSVAILGRLKSKQPAEHLTLERRKIEELRNQSIAEAKFDKLKKLKAAWEMKTDQLLEKSCVMRNIEKHFQEEQKALEIRKEKLKLMLEAEEKKYLLELDCKEEVDQQKIMKDKLEFLKKKRESEKQLYVAEKMEKKFREECHDLRTQLSKQTQNKIFADRNEQLLIKAEKLKKEAEIEHYFAEMCKQDIKYKELQEEIKAKEKAKLNQSVIETLNMQCQALENQRQEEKKIKQNEANILKKEVNELKAEENLRNKQIKAKMLFEKKEQDLLLKLKKESKAKEKDFDFETQNTYDKVLEKQMIEKKKRQQWKEMNCFMNYIEKTHHQKLQNERIFEEHIIEEVKKQMTKKDERMRKEKDAKKKLMDDVLKTRRIQVDEKQMLLKEKSAQKLVERQEIEKNIEEYKMLNNERLVRAKKENKKYQMDLLHQIEFEKQKKEKDAIEAKKEFQDMQNSGKQYYKKLFVELNKMDSSKLPPTVLPCIHSKNC